MCSPTTSPTGAESISTRNTDGSTASLSGSAQRAVQYSHDTTADHCRRPTARDLAYTYTPYGEVSPAHAYDQPLRWSGEYHDVELGLVYYNYRHYNPAMGRWTTADPATEGLNIYTFVHNHLIAHVDFLGREMEDCLCDYNIKITQMLLAKEELNDCISRCEEQRMREIYAVEHFQQNATSANASIGGPDVGGEGSLGQQLIILFSLTAAFIQCSLCKNECENNDKKKQIDIITCDHAFNVI